MCFFNAKIEIQTIIYIDRGLGGKKMIVMKPYLVQLEEFIKDLFEFLIDTAKLIFKRKGDKKNGNNL